MQCPRCMNHDTTYVSNSHYVCNNALCVDDHGNRTQFKVIEDSNIRFPYNQIFVNRHKHEFYRKPYIEIKYSGIKKNISIIN